MKCIGYGEFKGKCPNEAERDVSVIFCARCAKLRKEDSKKNQERSGPERHRVLAKERE